MTVPTVPAGPTVPARPSALRRPGAGRLVPLRTLGLAIGVAGALLLGVPGCSDPAAAARDAQAIESLRADHAKVQADLRSTTEDLKRLRGDVQTQAREIAALHERIASVESRPATVAGGGAAPSGGDAPKASATDKAGEAAEMEALRKKVFDGTATDEEQQRFWELARTTGRIDEMVKTLEGKVKDNPGDVGMRMELAEAYIAKLLSVPQGPEQGIWSMKAEGQWQAVLKLEPEHWDARYGVAFNWSMWPDFLNKTPDAVKEFEKLREVQERQSPEAKHAQTYFHLSRLYGKQGKADKAKEILRTGLARHPGDAELQKALDALE